MTSQGDEEQPLSDNAVLFVIIVAFCIGGLGSWAAMVIGGWK